MGWCREALPRPALRVRLPLLALVSVVAGNTMAASSVLQERPVAGFHAVWIAIPGAVEVRRGDAERLVLEAPPETLARIVTEVEDEVLHIRVRDPGWRLARPIRLRLTYLALDALDLSGSADVTTDQLAGETVRLSISGSSSVDVAGAEAEAVTVNVSGSGDLEIAEVATGALSIEVSGSGDVTANGRAQRQTVEVSGSGTVDTRNVLSQQADVDVGGSGNVRLWVTERLRAGISGSGDVAYRGEPEVVSEISGSGRLGPD
jgi:hypothetical protein